MILRRVRHLCPNVELNARERPTGREFFEDGGRSGIDALGLQSGKPQLFRKRHGKTAAERGGNKLVWIGSDSFVEARPKRVLGIEQHPALGTERTGSQITEAVLFKLNVEGMGDA